MSNVRYPDIEVQLVGEEGNAFSILGRVSQVLRRGGVSEKEVEEYMDEAMSGNYDDLLATTAQWVTVY